MESSGAPMSYAVLCSLCVLSSSYKLLNLFPTWEKGRATDTVCVGGQGLVGASSVPTHLLELFLIMTTGLIGAGARHGPLGVL